MTRAANRLHALQAKLGSRTGLRAESAPPDEEGKTSAELWLYGIVGGYWFGFNSKSVGDQLRGLNVDHLTVRLNSPGGDGFEGIAIANLLRNHKATVTIVVDGLAASSASIIAIAGDDVVMSPGSQLMLHDAWTWLAGNEKELRQQADWIGKQSQNLAEQYSLKAGGTAETWRAVMTAEPDGTWYTAQESVDAKLADRIGSVVAVSAAPEPPELALDEEDGDLLDALALHDLALIAPTALAVWSPAVNAALSGTPKPPSASAVGSTETEGGSVVEINDDTIKSLRSTLGLADDADEAAILAAAEAVVDQITEPTPKVEPSTPKIPEGMALVENAVLEDLKAGAAAGHKAGKELADQKRDAVIQAAIEAGKTTPARKEHWQAAWDADADGAKAQLDALAPGLVPVDEVGHGTGGNEMSADDELYNLVFGTEKKGA